MTLAYLILLRHITQFYLVEFISDSHRECYEVTSIYWDTIFYYDEALYYGDTGELGGRQVLTYGECTLDTVHTVDFGL